MAVRDGVGRASFYAIPAKNAPVVINVVNARVALSAAEANNLRVLGRFNVDTVGWARCRAKEASDAFFKARFIALQYVSATIAFFQPGRTVRICFRDRGLKHLLERDAHALGDGRSRTEHVTDIRHSVYRLAQQMTSGMSGSLHYDGVVRGVVLLLLAASLVFGDTFKLFLKDGGFHLVREYQIQGDRVRFYSTERSQWEEMPTALVDLDKTQREQKARQQEKQQEAREENEEDQAVREQRREIASIPKDPGGYYNQDGQVKALKLADYQVITDKKRKAIQMLSPIPLVPGKASVVIKGSHSTFVVNEPRPNFYMRLAKEERFGIIRLTPKKDARVVENIAIIAVSKQAIEERKQMDTFEQQLADGLYKVWPEKPLEPGEYALVEYADTEDQQDIELLVWDFAVSGAAR